jgi:hypothetical protein
MLNERDVDILQVEVEGFLEKLLAEYTRMWVGDRDGTVYSEEGRYRSSDSEKIRDNIRLAAGGEPRR